MVSHSYLILTSNNIEIQQLLTQAVQIKVSIQTGLRKKNKTKKSKYRSFMSTKPVLFSFPLFVSLLSFTLLMKCFLPPHGSAQAADSLAPAFLSPFISTLFKQIHCVFYLFLFFIIPQIQGYRGAVTQAGPNTLASKHVHSKLFKQK